SKQKALYGKTRTEVKQKEKLLNAAIQNQGYVETGKLTVKRYLEDWVKGLDSVKLVTKESYEENIRLHLIPHIGHIKLQQLRPLDIKNLLTVLKDKNLPARSRTYVLAILNAALNEA